MSKTNCLIIIILFSISCLVSNEKIEEYSNLCKIQLKILTYL